MWVEYMKIVFSGMLAISLSACVQVAVDPNAAPQVRRGSSVELNTNASAQVGDVMYSEFNYVAAMGAITAIPHDYSPSYNSEIHIPAGSNLMPTVVNGEAGYCTRFNAYRAILAGGPYRVCLFDARKTGFFYKATVLSPFADLSYDTYIPYSRGESIAPTGGFKNELTYQGMDRDTIRITYREYQDNFARPAFQQDLTYTQEKPGPTLISFRGGRIEITASDNNQIRYKILRGFSAQ